ncbi:Myb-like_DNA-binding domain-containing protein [Hexamita inflata]|uniref:Myb-like DNA-binding domain-containing protein n=1 Tax=Hexamita inflata TaxID=28002 RepID=A0AA86UDZ9_9EUKA|nr:Myb-like DNA-binding domain-containing protein [Hexamita inflata]
MSESKKFYQSWPDEDIHKLLDVTEKYLYDKIDWIKVASEFPTRTLQQCKSFYNNKVRKFIFDNNTVLNKEQQELVQYCYAYYITHYKPRVETVDDRVKRLLAEACWQDIFPTLILLMKNEHNYKYNKKLLVGASAFMKYHIHHSVLIDKMFTTQDKITIQGIAIRKEQWQYFCKQLNFQQLIKLSPEELLERIDGYIKSLE